MVQAKLQSLGFAVNGPAGGHALPELDPGRVYTWAELGSAFGFKPDYLGSARGMVPAERVGARLLITHPGGVGPYDYADNWDGEELICTGRG